MQEVNQQVGASLKAERALRGWSLDVTAKKTGVSKAMLGQIERGESSPTLATLWKIATGFELSLSRFIEPTLGEGGVQVRHAADVRHKPADDEMLVAPLFPYDKTTGFEMFELTLKAGYERFSAAHVTGAVEHIIVISGHLDLLVEQKWHSLKAGSAIRFAADAEHGYRNSSSEPAVFHNIIHYCNRSL